MLEASKRAEAIGIESVLARSGEKPCLRGTKGLLAARRLRVTDLRNRGMHFVVVYALTDVLVNELHRRLGS